MNMCSAAAVECIVHEELICAANDQSLLLGWLVQTTCTTAVANIVKHAAISKFARRRPNTKIVSWRRQESEQTLNSSIPAYLGKLISFVHGQNQFDVLLQPRSL